MQFKKLAAMAGSAIMAGLTIATPVLGATVSQVGKISDLVTVADSTVSFPMFVVGANAKTEDVAGAINVAVNMASYAKTTTTISTTGSTSESVTGGIKIRTPGNELVPRTALQSIKSVLTSSDLSTLADGSYQTASGGSSAYKQYLYLSGETAQTTYNLVDFVTPTTEDNPVINFKVTGNQILTTYKLTFSTPVTLSSVTATSSTLQAVLQGTTLDIMGKEFVITDCTSGATVTSAAIADITLVGGKNVVTIVSGEDKTVSVNDKDYVVHLDGVAQQTVGGVATYTAVGDINGEAFELSAGNTKTLTDQTLIAAIKVIQGKTGESDYVKIAVGADKIKISNSGTIKKSDKTITDVTATISSTSTGGWTGMTITWTPSSDTFVKAGEKLTDPFAGAFDVKFEGITPAFDDETNRQTIDFNPSQYTMKLKYMNAAGDTEDMYSLYYNTTSAAYEWIYTGITATSGDNGKRDIVFDESQHISAYENDYFVVSNSGFSRVLQFSTWTPTEGELTFTDLNQQSFTATNTTAATCDLVVDGHTYKVYTGEVAAAGRTTTDMATTKVVNIDLNGDGYIAGTAVATYASNATYNIAGREYSYLVPKLITSGQGGLYFYKGNTTSVVSTGAKYPAIGIGGVRLTSDNTTVTVAAYSAGAWTDEASTITLDATLGEPASSSYTLNNIDYTVNCYNTTALVTACNVGLGTSNSSTAFQTDTQGYVLVEEAQQGGTTHNWLFMPVAYDSTKTTVYINTPASDDANYLNKALTGISTTQGMTTYGTLATYYTGSSIGKGTMSYPDSFTYGNLYVMTPEGTVITSSTGEGGVESDTVLAITTDVVKIDSEVTSADKTANDFVLVGGPCVNSLVADLATDGKFAYTCDTWPGANMGIIELVSGAFAEGKTALIIAGTRAADTDLAARVVQDGTKLAGKTAGSVKVTGESFASVVVA